MKKYTVNTLSRKLACALLSVLLLCSALTFAACNDDENEDFPVLVAETTLKKAPSGVVALSPEAADILTNLGSGINLVGKSSDCTQSTISVIPTMGSAAAPDVSAIVNSGADTVFADETLGEVYLNQLQEADITVFRFPKAQNTSEVETMYKTIAKVVYGKSGGKIAEEKINSLYSALSSAVTTNETMVATCFLSLNKNNDLVCVGEDTVAYRVLSAVSSNVLITESGIVSAQTLSDYNPAFIICDDEAALQKVLTLPNADNLYAVSKNQCLTFSLDKLSLAGATALLNVNELAQKIYNIDVNLTGNINNGTDPEQPENNNNGSNQTGDLSSEYGITLYEGMEINASSDAELIKALQQRLCDLGYYTSSVDGEFGSLTERCIGDFQYLNNFTVDYIADYDLLVVMFSSSAVPRN